MGPKVEAACGFVRTTGNEAVIGALTDITAMIAGIVVNASGMTSRDESVSAANAGVP
jgi:hypothetical protein